MLSDFERAPRMYPQEPMADSREKFYDRKPERSFYANREEQLPPIQEPNNMNQSVALPLSMLLNNKNKEGAEEGDEEDGDENDDEGAKNYDLRVSLEKQNMMLERLAESLTKSEKQRVKFNNNPRKLERESNPNNSMPYPHPYNLEQMQQHGSKNEQLSERDFQKRIQELEKTMEMKALIAQQREKIEKLEMGLLQRKNPSEPKEDEEKSLLRALKDHMSNQQSNMMQMMMLAGAMKNQNQILPWPTQWG